MSTAMSGIRSFGSAHRYYQGPHALQLVGELAASLGSRPLLVADAIVGELIGAELHQVCAAQGLVLQQALVQGDVTRRLVSGIIQQATGEAAAPDVVVAAGGGKGVDTGKAVARELGARLIVLPTSASNDGPCSKSFVYYNDAHELESIEQLPRNPDAVVVDTLLLVRAPRALLVSGIGDALCKRYEGEQARGADGLNLFGGKNTIAAEVLSAACDKAIRENAVPGLMALERGEPDAAFERLTEALVLLAGLAFENSGLSIAHSMTRGLTRVPQIAAKLHGQQVAYGLLVQFMLEHRSAAFMQEQLRFYRSVGLCTSLQELSGLSIGEDIVRCIAEGTMTAPHLRHFARSVSAADFEHAMEQLEELSISTHLEAS